MNISSDNNKSDSSERYSSANTILSDLKKWISHSVDCLDRFSGKEKEVLLSEIDQIKATLNVVEQWVSTQCLEDLNEGSSQTSDSDPNLHTKT